MPRRLLHRQSRPRHHRPRVHVWQPPIPAVHSPMASVARQASHRQHPAAVVALAHRPRVHARPRQNQPAQPVRRAPVAPRVRARPKALRAVVAAVRAQEPRRAAAGPARVWAPVPVLARALQPVVDQARVPHRLLAAPGARVPPLATAAAAAPPNYPAQHTGLWSGGVDPDFGTGTCGRITWSRTCPGRVDGRVRPSWRYCEQRRSWRRCARHCHARRGHCAYCPRNRARPGLRGCPPVRVTWPFCSAPA